MPDNLPTIEYVGADGVRRKLEFKRVPDTPWKALLVESEEGKNGELRFTGSEVLRELWVNGEPATAVWLVDILEGP